MAKIQRQSKYLYDSTGNSVLLPKVIIQDLMYPEEPASFDPDNDASVSKGAKAVASCLKGETLIVAGLNLKTNGGKVEAILTNNGLSLINNDASGNITLKSTNVKIGEGVSGNLNVEGQMTGKLLTVTGDDANPSTINGKLVIVSDTSSSTKETGAIVISKKTTIGKPGLGVEGNINSGGDINAAGKVKGNKLEATTSLTVDGTSTLTGNVTASSNITATSTSSGKGVITATNIVSNKRLTVGAEGVSVTGDSTFNNNVTVKQSAKAKVNNISDVYLGVPIGAMMMWPGDTAPDCWAICNGEWIFVTSSSSSPTAKGGTDLAKTVNSSGQKTSNISLTKDETQRLLNIIGTKYGSGTYNGEYYVCLPSFRGMVPLGAGSTGGPSFELGESENNKKNGYLGEYKHKLTANESGIQSHTHPISTDGEHHHDILRDGGNNDYVAGIRINDASSSKCQYVEANNFGNYTKNAGGHSHTITNVSADAINVHNNVQPYQTVHFIIKVK